MTTDEKPKIRKVWLPTEMKNAVTEYCWANHAKPSPFIVELIEDYLANPTQYAGEPIPPAGKDYASVYVTDTIWKAGLEQAAQTGVTLSAVVRVAIAKRLAEADILWNAETARPKNERIPIRE